MARTVEDAAIEKRTQRSRLARDGKQHWRSLGDSVSIGWSWTLSTITLFDGVAVADFNGLSASGWL
jgi:hypothetical protein